MIRGATLEDARALAEVQIRAWWRAYADYVDHALLAEHTVQRRETRWHEILTRPSSPQSATFVAEVAGRVAGFVAIGAPMHMEPRPGLGEVHALYVDPPAQGAGLGTRLLGHAEDELRARGFTRAALCVFERNELARAFYERHGWRPEDPPVLHHDRWAPELRYHRKL